MILNPNALRIGGGGARGLAAGLLAYFKLEEGSGTRASEIGIFPLTDVNTVVSDTGKIGSAALFASANLEGLTSTAGGLALLGDFTISAWVNPSALAAGDGTDGRGIVAFHANDAIGDYLLGVRPTGAIVCKQWKNTGSDATGGHVTSTTPVTTGSFQHIVALRRAGTYFLYHNNVSLSHASVGSLTGYGNAKFVIGSSWTQTQATYNWDGLIDELAIWNHGITDAQVSQLYNGGAGRPYPLAA